MKIFILLLFLAPFSAYTCSCGDWDDIRQMSKDADTVVLAVPTEDSSFFRAGEYAPLYKTGMKIVKKYKGKYENFFYLLAEKADGGNCGLNFKKHSGLFLIFGHKYNNSYYISDACSIGDVSPFNEEVQRAIEQLDN